MDIHDFPLLASGLPSNKAARLQAALGVLDGAKQGADLYNSDYVAAKKDIDAAIDYTWDNKIRISLDIDWQSLRTDPNSPSPEDKIKLKQYLMLSIYLNSMLEVKRGIKKIGQIQCFDAVQRKLKAFADEVLPLATLCDELKAKVIMTRKPAVNKTQVNPNKVVKTCPCCFRPIAVENNKMVLHGFNVTRGMRDFSSCPASNRFPAFETSTVGTDWLITELTEKLIKEDDKKSEADIVYQIKFLRKMLDSRK